jgi:hypothetical protein
VALEDVGHSSVKAKAGFREGLGARDNEGGQEDLRQLIRRRKTEQELFFQLGI